MYEGRVHCHKNAVSRSLEGGIFTIDLVKPRSAALNRGHAALELGPVNHDGTHADIFEHLFHFLLLLCSLVTPNIADGWDSCPDSTGGSALAVLDSNTLAGLDSDLLAGKDVDGRVGLGRRFWQRGSRTENVVWWKVFFLADFLDRRLDSSDGRRGHNSHAVLLGCCQFVELGHDTLAGLGLLLQGRNHSSQLLTDVMLKLTIRESEIVLLLKRNHHAAEVLAHKVVEKSWPRVAVWNAFGFEDLVGQIGTGFKGQLLGQHKGVVTVKKDFFDLD
jgi:hypothetical protein